MRQELFGDANLTAPLVIPLATGNLEVDAASAEINLAFSVPLRPQWRRPHGDETMCELRNALVRSARAVKFFPLHRKYRAFTMAARKPFWRNMLIVDQTRHVQGCVIECGVWRGGMSAGMAEVLGPTREYFLFDSFEGLPPATLKDGEAARAWQQDTESPSYYDNCRASVADAEKAMALSGVPRYTIIKGWFDQTLPAFVPPSPIAILRVDGDWYDSTMIVLESLFRFVAKDGIVILDDYYAWDGCSLAVHDFLSKQQSTARIMQKHGLCVIEPRVVNVTDHSTS
jgi:O-methyltransferase